MANVYRECCFIPKGRGKLHLNTFRLTEAFEQPTLLCEDYAGDQMNEIGQALKDLST